MKDEFSYEDSGVDVSLGDKCSKIAYETCLKTYKNRNGRFGKPEEWEEGFTAPIRVDNLEESYLVKNSDGIGSKALIAQRIGKHDTIANDLIAMNVGDTVSIGAEPFVATNTLDIKKMNIEVIKELMEGLSKACKKARIAMVGGEIAELVDQVKGYKTPYIWNADVLGVLEKGKKIDGTEISKEDKIVAIKSNGMRSNGLTLARKICEDNFGENWHEIKLDSETWGEKLLKPSIICAKGLVDLFGGYKEKSKAKVTGIVHVTGGGILNFKRILKNDLGVKIDDLFEPHKEFLELQELGPVSEEEAYKTWNMGQCFFITTPEPENVIEILKSHNLKSKIVGEVIQNNNRIEIQSKGLENKKIELR